MSSEKLSHQLRECDVLLRGKRILAAISGLELFGHERGNIEALRALRSVGADVLCAVNDRPDNHVREHLEALGFPTFPLPFGPQWSKKWFGKEPSLLWRQPRMAWQCSRFFLRAFDDFRPTHIHLGLSLAYSYLALALARRDVPLVYRMGDCPPVESPPQMLIWKAMVRRSHWFVANSDYVRRSAIAQGVPEDRVRTLLNHPPDRGPGARPVSHEVGKAGTEPGKGKTEVLYVGAISEAKGLVPLVDAFAMVSDEYFDLHLNIVGGSRWTGAFEEIVKGKIEEKGLSQRITLLGFVNDPGPYYRLASVHIAPSLWQEPSGNTAVEAKREGTPSVIFRTGGLTEHVRHQVDGFICQEKTAQALADAMRWVLADPERLDHMGRAAREDYDTRFGWERFRRAWAEVYLAAEPHT